MSDVYPVNEYGPVMPGLVMAAVAIVHVFLAQFAVGGGILLCYFQWLGMSGRSEHARQFVAGYFKALVLISFIVGALTGYSVLLKSPAYLGYALSHAIAIAGLLTLVFSLPVLLDTWLGEAPAGLVSGGCR